MADKYGFEDQFARSSIEQLISVFNCEVGKKGWGNARMHFLAALQAEFLRRKYDCSSFISTKSMSLKNPIELIGNQIKTIAND